MSRVIDLTLNLQDNMRGVSMEPSHTLERDGWNATTLHLYSHCGTHMDAPKHFDPKGQTIDEIPLDRCMGLAWVVDAIDVKPHAVLGLELVHAIDAQVQTGDSLLIRTGWSKHVRTPLYRDEPPRVGLELAQWCVDNGIRILGVEPPSVADVHNLEEVTKVHRVLMGGGVIIVEGLTNLDAIKQEKVTLMAFPLKYEQGDGAPVRALAIEQ